MVIMAKEKAKLAVESTANYISGTEAYGTLLLSEV